LLAVLVIEPATAAPLMLLILLVLILLVLLLLVLLLLVLLLLVVLLLWSRWWCSLGRVHVAPTPSRLQATLRFDRSLVYASISGVAVPPTPYVFAAAAAEVVQEVCLWLHSGGIGVIVAVLLLPSNPLLVATTSADWCGWRIVHVLGVLRLVAKPLALLLVLLHEIALVRRWSFSGWEALHLFPESVRPW
jgi:hypothetical protein